ncbi:sigma-54-dependent transcriptional regulator [Fluviispira multicolorata]|uniref:Response regulator n=1 Tax=Fluviispira multicolorata TaxID=2654512 RepID=A0A833JEA5_9BACT|nr:sigma 54-interacting transcriptional regulator [Fluviispira multicolorata]KAB8031952.1 response regulator [Fluviispira multicolorata]
MNTLFQNVMTAEEFILIHLDDDPLELKSFARKIQTNKKNISFNIISVINLLEFKKMIQKIKKIDFAILDIYLSEKDQQDGISIVSELRKLHPEIIVLMSSNLDDPESILQSLKAGADEFLSKKFKMDNIVDKILSIRKSAFLKRGISDVFQQKKECQHDFLHSFAGATVRKIYYRIPQIINSAITSVYVEGESGTGKEIVADLFSYFVKDMPFIKVNCGSISQSLLESVLFGHVKGAFTGANTHKSGLLEDAHGGWLFLDEVASLSTNAQVALLRVLENQEVTRIGESTPRKINVRFIAASNIPLGKQVEKGEFRNDLWQRLCETEILLKSLRERKNEIPDLISFFCKKMRGGPYKIEQTAMNVLCQLPWDEGNVRELRNCLRAMTEHQNKKVLSPMGIPERILEKSKEKDLRYNELIIDKDTLQIPIKNQEGKLFSFKEMCEILLRTYLKTFYAEKMNLSLVAKKLGIARSTLQIKYNKIKSK